MKMKTSLVLHEETMPLVKQCARAEGMDASQWAERALLRAVAEAEISAYDAWKETWSDADKEFEAAERAMDAVL